jgi:hypothetical protein
VEVKSSRPVFNSVVDLGLRDVGVENNSRELAARLAKASAAAFVLLVLSAMALCAIVAATGADPWVVLAFPLAWAVGMSALLLRIAKRARPVVVAVSADGTNQATWLVMVVLGLLALVPLLAWEPLLFPLVVIHGILSLAPWRGRGRVPEILSTLRDLLAPDESVLGDGFGLVRRARRQRDALRVVIATDRRLLVAASTRSTERFPLVDVPYRRVSRFGIEWKFGGRAGELSLTVDGVDGELAETHVISSIAPANLVSIAKGLQAHGVQADDPAAVLDAERGWEDAKQRPESKERLLDRAAMSTREFDRGVWLLLGLFAVTFYVNPFDVGLGASRQGVPVLLAVPVLCAICGYVSATRASIAYIAPLNLLIAPAFFFAPASDVAAVMVVLSVLAAIGLWAGSALRRGAAASPRPPAGPGSLRYAISGLVLTRISGVLVAALVALVVTASAAGFELSSLRLAVDGVTSKQLRADGRSNLTGNAASLTYTRAPDLQEFITDEHWDGGPNDGARWELRSSSSKEYNVVSLAHYIFEPRLDDQAAIAEFLADKDREHTEGAGFRVTHSDRVVDGRKGYVWTYGERGRYWYYAAWFPQPVHSVRLECVARGQIDRFKRLCAQAVASLKFPMVRG